MGATAGYFEQCQNCQISQGGRLSSFYLTVDNVPCHVSLERESDRRRRVLTARLKNGYQLSLDFSMEPGFIRIGQELFSGDDQWDRTLHPIQRQIQEFLDVVATPEKNSFFKMIAVQSIQFTESANDLLFKNCDRIAEKI